jgi:hypothetical protein
MKSCLTVTAFLAASVLLGVAHAETILVGDQVNVVDSGVARPPRGATQAAVEARFGAPVQRHPTVGQPPITRWDYPGFAVFFERDRVIHAVAIPAS